MSLGDFDSLGLASETEVFNGTLCYTWYLGWLDYSHYRNDSLKEPWRLLKEAEEKDVVEFSLRMDQALKVSTAKYRICAKEKTQRKGQLLCAWMRFCEQFEEYQKTGPQGSSMVNMVSGAVVQHQFDKHGSGMSTEDLVSDLVAFYAIVEGQKPKKLIKDYAGVFDGWDPKDKVHGYKDDSGLISMAIWKNALRCTQGSGGWTPTYFDYAKFMKTNFSVGSMPPHATPFFPSVHWYYMGGAQVSAEKAQRILGKYQRKYGAPHMPEYFTRYTSNCEGVTLLESADE